jgi:hypothetical protein
MLNSLENYVWRYNSAVELVNLIFTYIEQNALRVYIVFISHVMHVYDLYFTRRTCLGIESLWLPHTFRVAGSTDNE